MIAGAPRITICAAVPPIPYRKFVFAKLSSANPRTQHAPNAIRTMPFNVSPCSCAACWYQSIPAYSRPTALIITTRAIEWKKLRPNSRTQCLSNRRTSTRTPMINVVPAQNFRTSIRQIPRSGSAFRLYGGYASSRKVTPDITTLQCQEPLVFLSFNAPE